MLRGPIIAIQFLTRIPTPQIRDFDPAEMAAAIRWFPAVGLLVGAIVAGAWWLGARIDPWAAGLAGLVAWVLVTGALHLDGLGDLADALGASHRDPERLLAVMKDPHVGSFGAIALILQCAAKLVLLALLASRIGPWPLLLVPALARIGPLAWTRWLPPLGSGLAERFAWAVRPADILIWSIAALAAFALFPPLAMALPLVAGWGLWLRWRLGGASGDCHGAGIELVETGLLAALLVAAG
ncbi:Cobalamin synthase [Sphingomonas haloaromaticamans]|uniref:Adenosylcobinamide-GDP ribazoletransferase n=1 Tax=Edaphosphingomonas haloaromaticamans TaxID=653954 RepID=A0A1S1HHP6_9SPHN|nr:Cobalamin synthase [Sphingomonas haloaromaticamans]